MNRPLRTAAAGLLAALALSASHGAAAQSVLERTPNLTGGWVGAGGTLHFNFLHRFDASDGPTRKVSNSPTFLVGWSIGGAALAGVHYATSSTLVTGIPNEWELLVRAPLLATGGPVPVGLHLTAARNAAARSWDGELGASLPVGPATVMAAVRGFSDFRDGDARVALGGGAAWRLTDHVGLAADVVTLADRDEGEDVAWGAGLQVAIPSTPHTLSLQVTNTNAATLQGSAFGSSDARFGFEFTVPLTVSRYLGGGRGEDRTVTADTVRVAIRDFEYGVNELTIRPGTTVIWTNEGQVPHTATSDEGVWDSPFLGPGESYQRVFDEVGTYPYHCTPHPFMQAVIVVEGS